MAEVQTAARSEVALLVLEHMHEVSELPDRTGRLYLGLR